jgi:hypothetical protein
MIFSTVICAITFAVISISIAHGCQGSAIGRQESTASAAREIGPFVLTAALDGRKRTETEARVRQYLWESFRNHRSGSVRVTQYSKEGESTTISFAVASDSDGSWRVHARVDRRRIDQRFPGKEFAESSDLYAYGLQRVPISRTPMGAPAGITPGFDLGEPYQLALLARDGTQLLVF